MKDLDYFKYYDSDRASIYNNTRLDAPEDRNNTIRIIQGCMRGNQVHLLDIGCGTGEYAKSLAEYGHTVLGIDKAEAQIDKAKQVIEAQVADALDLPFADNSYDLCIMIMVIHQMSSEERIRAFQEAHRVLKSDGSLVIKTCSHRDLDNRFTSRFFHGCKELDLMRYPDIEQLQEELAIFKIINIRSESVMVKYDKNDLIRRFKLRKSSNMSILSKEELYKGIQRFKEYYENEEQIIEKEACNTFFICSKR